MQLCCICKMFNLSWPLIKIMTRGISTKRLKRGAIQVLTLFVLVLYTAGTSHLEYLHSMFHGHDVAVTHSDAQEKDPCHRLLYHNDTMQGCDHSSHLIVSDKCEMCDLVYHGDQTMLSDLTLSNGEFSSEHFDLYKSNLGSYWAVISSSRAPPALI